MFSTTLQTRPSLSALIPLLSSANPPLQASPFITYDLEFPLPSAPTPPPHHPATTVGVSDRKLLVLLLAASDISGEVKEAETVERLERFAALTGGEGCVVAFLRSERDDGIGDGNLLQDGGGVAVGEGSRGYARVQILWGSFSYYFSVFDDRRLLISAMPARMHDHPTLPPLPLLPIPAPSSFLPAIRIYITTLTAPTPLPPVSFNTASSPSLILLPHSTSLAPRYPLSQHETFVLSDICPDLASVALMTQSAGGRVVLREYLGEDVVRGVQDFWGEEWVLD
ncbi:MAG: hypothetical protein MMC33_008626 [Icmadophila ericetorum]|nr:hypothetical protein [Icmadophila ericetorum]